MQLGDYTEDYATLNFKFTTRKDTGLPTVLAGSPVISIYKGSNVAPKTSAEAYITLTIDFNSKVGLNHVLIDLSGDAFFVTGEDYQIVITTGTVNLISVIGEVVAEFSIENRFTEVDVTKWAGADVVAGAIPAAAADTAGGLAISDAGGLDIDNRMASAAVVTRMNLMYGADSVYAPKYSGPRGPGVYLNDAAGNTNTTNGTDGTFQVPVSTIAAAKTLADSMGFNRIYLVNDSNIILAAAMVDYEFVGIGEIASNVVNLGSQDVSQSFFCNLSIQGTQGGSGRISACGCALADPGAGATTLHICAHGCGIVDEIEVDTSADNVFDQCFSLVSGTAAPIIIATGASGTISVRHFSGGIEFKSLSASHNVSLETDGQVIFNADCSVNATVVLRGNMTITDNTAGMNNLTTDAVYDKRAVLADWINGGRLDTIIDSVLADTNELQSDDVPTLIAAVQADTTKMVAGIVNGTVDTVTNTHTPTITEFQADDITEATADHFIGRIVTFLTGVLTGQSTDITDYVAVGGIAQFTVTAMTDPPANDDTFKVT